MFFRTSNPQQKNNSIKDFTFRSDQNFINPMKNDDMFDISRRKFQIGISYISNNDRVFSSLYDFLNRKRTMKQISKRKYQNFFDNFIETNETKYFRW